MKGLICLIFVFLSVESYSAQKDTLGNNFGYSFGFQANAMNKTFISNQYTEHFLKNIKLTKGALLGIQLGVDWRGWKITYCSSYAYMQLYYALGIRNSKGMLDTYAIRFNQKSLINSLEFSRLLLIPESKYSFEIGVGVGFNYLLPEIRSDNSSQFIGAYKNEYGISNSVVNNNPNHYTTHFENVFLRFYRQIGKHSIGLNMDLINIVNPFVVDLYTEKKYVLSTNETSRSFMKKFSQFSFGINYKLTLGR